MSDIKKRPNRKDYINKSTKIQLIADQELYIDYLESQQQTIDNLTKEVEGLREEFEDAEEEGCRMDDENTKLKEEVEDLANELLFYTSILEGTEQGKTLKENTKLRKGLNDIKSQLFDINNCDTILTSAIEQILKNK
tara:strand:+ start:202 stop:612 length:411 start_codon:yes stop_codon:yes gene_type:complete